MAGKRRLLRFAGVGCASIVLIVVGLTIWVALQVREMTAPVVLTDYHPFRSRAKKERYLAYYDARAARWPAPSETLFVDTTWGATFVRISGSADGPPLVLLPGAGATSLMFAPNVAGWAERFRVYAVDNVYDFGRSVYVRDLKSPDDYVDWLDQVLDGLGLRERVNLLGLSYGGWIASQYGLRHPERLSRLVLVAPAATVAQLSPDFVKRGLMCVIPHPYFIKSMVRWSIAGATKGTPEQRRLAEEAAENAWIGLRCLRPRKMVDPTILSDEQWRSYRVPVLFLVGENEVIYEVSARQAVARLEHAAPQIETEVFPRCGHDISIVQTEQFNRRVARFLAPDDESKPGE
jgi:pimeloyl-ACP methyl ester carboxylesterase